VNVDESDSEEADAVVTGPLVTPAVPTGKQSANNAAGLEVNVDESDCEEADAVVTGPLVTPAVPTGKQSANNAAGLEVNVDESDSEAADAVVTGPLVTPAVPTEIGKQSANNAAGLVVNVDESDMSDNEDAHSVCSQDTVMFGEPAQSINNHTAKRSAVGGNIDVKSGSEDADFVDSQETVNGLPVLIDNSTTNNTAGLIVNVDESDSEEADAVVTGPLVTPAVPTGIGKQSANNAAGLIGNVDEGDRKNCEIIGRFGDLIFSPGGGLGNIISWCLQSYMDTIIVTNDDVASEYFKMPNYNGAEILSLQQVVKYEVIDKRTNRRRFRTDAEKRQGNLVLSTVEKNSLLASSNNHQQPQPLFMLDLVQLNSKHEYLRESLLYHCIGNTLIFDNLRDAVSYHNQYLRNHNKRLRMSYTKDGHRFGGTIGGGDKFNIPALHAMTLLKTLNN
jgi:hypothetical protein